MKTIKSLVGIMVILILFMSMGIAQDYATPYNEGVKAYKEKSYDSALMAFHKAMKAAKEAGNDEMTEKASLNLAKTKYKMGKEAYKQEQYDLALEHYLSGVNFNSDYVNNNFGAGKVLGKLGRTDEAIAQFETTIANGDEKLNEAGAKALRNVYYKQVRKSLQKEETTKNDAANALAALDICDSKAGLDANGYYYKAMALNVNESYEEAVVAADKAITMSEGSADEKAKFYFVKGKILIGAGNDAAAKEAFTNASHGKFVESANYYLEKLSKE